jgi:hypothetical protein
MNNNIRIKNFGMGIFMERFSQCFGTNFKRITDRRLPTCIAGRGLPIRKALAGKMPAAHNAGRMPALRMNLLLIYFLEAKWIITTIRII